MSWILGFYANSRDDKPVEEFIYSLDDATFNKVMRVMDLLKVYGPKLSLPYAKRISSTIYELRTSGKVPIRLLYTWHNSQFVLLNSFKKKTNKLPSKELKLAEERLDRL
jgi:phage-related protein